MEWTESDAGELVVVAGRLSKLDPRDGHALERACGWGFGLYDTPVHTSRDCSLVCDE